MKGAAPTTCNHVSVQLVAHAASAAIIYCTYVFVHMFLHWPACMWGMASEICHKLTGILPDHCSLMLIQMP
jgi:hypothetical protein